MSNGVFYMASASQDKNIRLWKIQPLSNVQEELQQTDEQEDDDLDIAKYQSKTSYILDLGDDSEQVYNVSLYSVLVNHGDAVSSVEWNLIDPTAQLKQITIDDISLLSSSFDFTVCIW